MAEQQNRTKEATINLRVSEELKADAEWAAEQDHRKLTPYIEKLILDDVAAKRARTMPQMVRAAPRSGRRR